MADEPIKAFCVDFNWDLLGRFASPGLYAHADARQHVAWYADLGANVIQSFCVSHNGYAWYDSDVAPRTPGMRGSFLGDLVRAGHARGMRVMGYFSPGANAAWGRANPSLHHAGVHSWQHVPFTTTYLDHLCRAVEEAINRTGIDGFMIDWLWNVRPTTWLDCERAMYRELFGAPFPGADAMTDAATTEFCRRAVQRAWRRIRDAAKSKRGDLVLWLSCNDLAHPTLRDTTVLREVDWLMNEHPDPAAIELAKRSIGPGGRVIQCACGWGEQHDAPALLARLGSDPSIGFYGFARPDPTTTLPDVTDASTGRNTETLRHAFTSAGKSV